MTCHPAAGCRRPNSRHAVDRALKPRPVVALDALRGEQTVAELSAKHSIYQTMIAA